jgi:cytosine/adenosine deaminase-related metal-dependent hydrolase
MRKISADYIFPISSPPIKNGVIVVDEEGVIVTIENSKLRIQDSKLEVYEGFICPGFINTHCHLELSYMKGKIKENAGLDKFIKELLAIRFKSSREEILNSIEKAEAEMIDNGIVAVGDISNDDSTFIQKNKKNLKYHTFIELFDLGPEKAEQEFQKGISLQLSLHQNSKLKTDHSSITPHAPYSVSGKSFGMINAYANETNSILSIHNQECEAESELFISKSGKLFDLFSSMKINLDYIPKTGTNSLRSTLTHFAKHRKILLVHNTFASKEDIQWAHTTHNSQFLYWCTCPNANLYIENTLPDYNTFIAEKAKITIGTDSYASNWSLSVLDELKTISKHTPNLPLETLLTWATHNGAVFLNFDKELGTIEKGKKPGINLIKNVDLKNLKLTEKSKVEVLV